MGRLPDEEDRRSRVESGIVTIAGRSRLPTDVRSELMAVLATEPRILVCDLTGMAAAESVTPIFEPVAPYLQHWPGTVVVAVVPDPRARASLRSAAISDRLLVRAAAGAGIAEARELVAEASRVEVRLMPTPTAPRDARSFTTRALLDWQTP